MDQTRDEPGPESAWPGDGRDSAGEEFRLLLEALAFRAEEFLHGLGAGDAFAERGAGHGADAGGSSRREPCPMCAVLAVLRGERPELASTVFEQLASLLALLRRVLVDNEADSFPGGGRGAADQDRQGDGGPLGGGDTATDGEEPDTGPGVTSKVQHIDVRRVRGNVVQQARERDIAAEGRAEGLGC